MIGCIDPYNAANWLFILLDEIIALILQRDWHESRDPGIITIDKSSVRRIFADRDLPRFKLEHPMNLNLYLDNADKGVKIVLAIVAATRVPSIFVAAARELTRRYLCSRNFAANLYALHDDRRFINYNENGLKTLSAGAHENSWRSFLFGKAKQAMKIHDDLFFLEKQNQPYIKIASWRIW